MWYIIIGCKLYFLGSIKTNFTSSGFVRINIEEIIAFTHTDLPLPVAPAINKDAAYDLIHRRHYFPLNLFPKQKK